MTYTSRELSDRYNIPLRILNNVRRYTIATATGHIDRYYERVVNDDNTLSDNWLDLTSIAKAQETLDKLQREEDSLRDKAYKTQVAAQFEASTSTLVDGDDNDNGDV